MDKPEPISIIKRAVALPSLFSRLPIPALIVTVGAISVFGRPLQEATAIRQSAHSNQPADEADSLALVAFYNGTRGDNWTIRSQWLFGPVELWYGVTLTDGRVTELNLPSNSVSGSIPPEIGDLDRLEKIDLQNNSLFSIPPEIGKLVELRELDLQFNWQIRDSVPDEITNLVKLEKLRLNRNRLRYLPDLTLLDPIAGVGSLDSVDVSNNELGFDDIEPSYGLSFDFVYSPQWPAHESDAVQFNGDSLTLHYPVGGEFNRYQWFKDGEALDGETTDRYDIGIPTRADQGIYVLEITNALVTDLVLNSGDIDYRYTEEYTAQWLDIGAYHHAYSESGSRHWIGADTPTGMEYPAILRHSTHNLSNGFWIGIKDWTDSQGEHYPYYVARLGPNQQGAFFTYPIENRLIGRYEDTVVEVNGEPSFDNEAILDEVDPSLPADRMVHNVNNMSMGITVDRKIYAYTNEFHDNYHIKDITYCNTGNIDDDEEVELPDQTLHDVIFYSLNRWTGSRQATYAMGGPQRWARYTVYDVVGDGYEEYPVDFTAQYAWAGWTFSFFGHSELGGPLFSDEPEAVAPGDSIGRLAGATMMGHSVIHADASTTDPSYDREQPAYMSWIWNDSNIYNGRVRDENTSRRATHEEFYEQGIVAPPLINNESTCTDCRREYPHFAERNQPNGLFWDFESRQLGMTNQVDGGFSSTTGYGPYEMGPGECIRITESEGIAGLSFDAATKIGRAFKRAGSDRNTSVIEYDANGDGQIDTTPFDFDNVFVGAEAQTKDQWFMSARDSLFQTFYRARDLHEASQGMTVYPIPEPPRPPTRFSLWSRPRHIDLEWTPAPDGPAVTSWELYRTEHWEDNLYASGCLDDPSIACGYELVAKLSAETTAYADTEIAPGVDYFYYLQAVGETQSDDPEAIHGTPGGVPLRSGRYLTQTYTPVRMISGVASEDADLPGRFQLHGNYPNPFSGETRIRYELPAAADVELVVYDILGREVEVLVREFQAEGRHEYSFSPKGLASGVYIYVLEAGGERAEGRMLVVR